MGTRVGRHGSVWVLLALLIPGCRIPFLTTEAHIRFRDAKGLRPGSVVRLAGVSVGKVDAVGVTNGFAFITIEVPRKHREEVCINGTFRIVDSSGDSSAPGVAIEVTPAQPCDPLVDGVTIQGTDGWLQAGLKGFRVGVQALAGALERAANSPEAAELRQLMLELAADAGALASASIDEIHREWPKFLRRAKDFADQLRSASHLDLANALDRALSLIQVP